MTRLVHLAGVFARLSMLALGGGTSVLPEMQHFTVHVFHWLSDKQFRDIYSLGQVAPGPNGLMVIVIGYRLAGAAGAAVVAVSFFLPSCIIAFVANRIWRRYEGSPWQVAIQRGVAPVAVGLMFSGTYSIARLAIIDALTLIIAAVVAGLLLWRHTHPAAIVVLGGLAYLLLPH